MIYGFGLGLGMQRASVAAQTELDRKDVPTGASLMMLCQNLGGAVFLPVAESIFTNSLASRLESVHDCSSCGIISGGNIGATDLRKVVATTDPQDMSMVLSAYNYGVTQALIVALALSCFSIFGAVATRWTSIKKPPVKNQGKSVNNTDIVKDDGNV